MSVLKNSMIALAQFVEFISQRKGHVTWKKVDQALSVWIIHFFMHFELICAMLICLCAAASKCISVIYILFARKVVECFMLNASQTTRR